jgi:hypothetical protein
MAVDISAACSGFVYAMAIADQFVRTGPNKSVLVVGAEILHPYVNYKDRDTCILFGDAAGAAILTRANDSDDSTIYSHHLHADGSISDLFVLPGGGSVMPFSQEVLDSGSHYVRMKGREIFKNAVRTMSQACQEALEFNKMDPSQVSWVIPHQANVRIIEAVAKHFGIPMEKVRNHPADLTWIHFIKFEGLLAGLAHCAHGIFKNLTALHAYVVRAAVEDFLRKRHDRSSARQHKKIRDRAIGVEVMTINRRIITVVCASQNSCTRGISKKNTGVTIFIVHIRMENLSADNEDGLVRARSNELIGYRHGVDKT